jgi:hypothetical protein
VITVSGDENDVEPNLGAEFFQTQIVNLINARLTGAKYRPNLERPVQFNRIVLTFTEWIENRAKKSSPKDIKPHFTPVYASSPFSSF